jgi:class 3 adenylate cyclase
MRCPGCGTENQAGRKFCVECGNRLSTGCPSCGTPYEAGEKFCGECGTALSEAASGPAGAPSETPAAGDDRLAERRLVSVLFADLVGFTGLAEDQDPEEARELLSRYFATARTTIERYGGRAEKFIGDAVMALWGAPVAHEDDAERAVRAALDLVDAVAGLDGRLTLRAGVLTGEAAVTLGAEGEGMVAGDLVNTASRLQAAAAPGSVYVGDATYRSTRDAVAYEPIEEQTLKGKSLPVAAWQALRVIAGRGGSRRSEQLEPPFVGRDPELRQLKALLHETGAERRARLVSIVGQPGIGKTRLIWEFEKYVDGIVESVAWHQGRSPAYGEGITFWALGEMVRTRAGLAETDDQATSLEQLGATLREWMPDEHERAWVAPRLAALLGLRDSPGGDRSELFAAWRRFFERISERTTTVLVFEDLQWADKGLVDFIESLLEWSRNYPILVISLARPELLDRHSSWGAGMRSFTSLHLDPLPEEAMRALLEGLAPGLPNDATHRIVERAEGVPLYAVETVRMLIDAGRLVRDDEAGRYRLTGDLGELRVSESLHALIAARLDALEASDRQLLQDAAVLGQTFTVQALAAISNRAVDDVEERLRALVRRELLTFHADPRSPERGQFGFVQGVVREVAHETLARRDRRTRHLAAARYYEALGEDELAAVLASHYHEAYRATPEGPEADALAAQARLALRAAAERAAALHSHAQATALYCQAVSLTTDPVEQALLLERAGQAAEAEAQLGEAQEYYAQAADRYVDAGDRLAAARAGARRAGAQLMSGMAEEARQQLDGILTEIDVPGADAATVAQVAAQLGRAEMLLADDRALEHLERALVLAADADDVRTLIEAMTSKGAALHHAQRRREGVGVLAGAVKLADLYGITAARFRAMYNLAGRLAQDDVSEASEVLREGYQLATELGDRQWLLGFAEFRANIGVNTGEWDWIEAELPELLTTQLPDAMRARMAAVLAIVAANRGDAEAAASHIATAERHVRGVTKSDDLANFLWARHDVAFGAGRVSEAYEIAMELAASTAGSDFPAWGAAQACVDAVLLGDEERCRRAAAAFEEQLPGGVGRLMAALSDRIRAVVAVLDGRTDEAAAGFERGADTLREMRTPLDLAQGQAVAAVALGLDNPLGRAAAEEARGVFDQLRAHALRERLEEALERRAAEASFAD